MEQLFNEIKLDTQQGITEWDINSKPMCILYDVLISKINTDIDKFVINKSNENLSYNKIVICTGKYIFYKQPKHIHETIINTLLFGFRQSNMYYNHDTIFINKIIFENNNLILIYKTEKNMNGKFNSFLNTLYDNHHMYEMSAHEGENYISELLISLYDEKCLKTSNISFKSAYEDENYTPALLISSCDEQCLKPPTISFKVAHEEHKKSEIYAYIINDIFMEHFIHYKINNIENYEYISNDICNYILSTICKDLKNTDIVINKISIEDKKLKLEFLCKNVPCV